MKKRMKTKGKTNYSNVGVNNPIVKS